MASERSASIEAISHLTKGLDLLQTAAGHGGACPARAHTPNGLGRTVDGHEGLCSPGRRNEPMPGPGHCASK